MFEKLFVKTSDLMFHKIAPYAVERERFLAHCCEEGFSKAALRRIAGILVTAACDLHAHGGLDVDQECLEAAAGRIEMTRRQAGVLDVRLVLQTDDLQKIYMTWRGISYTPQGGTQYARILPLFETGAAQYAWLNNIVAVGVHRPMPRKVAYRVYRIL